MPRDDAADSPTIRLLARLSSGDDSAREELLELVYHELHGIAARLMQRQQDAHTLQPTALIHEAWLKLVRVDDQPWEGRGHFLRVAARAMRTVLIDHARARQALRRTDGKRPVTLHDDAAFDVRAGDPGAGLEQALAVHEGLRALAEVDPGLAQTVELRFFGGLTNAEIAEATGSSLRSVERSWQFAKAWLQAHLAEGGEA